MKSVIKEDSRSYVILCYAKTRNKWFTVNDYRNFQMNRTAFIKDVERNFTSLQKYGFLDINTANGKTEYKINEHGLLELKKLGVIRKESEYERFVQIGKTGSEMSRVSRKLNRNAAATL
jgi:hypothetical protein